MAKHDYSKVFDTDDELWQRVLEIYEANEKFPKKIVSGRNLHHKFPRSFSKKLGEDVDNDKDNLVSLSLSDHFLIHYYYYKLARTGYKQSMAMAFNLMAKKQLKYISPETAESMAKDYEEALKLSNKERGKQTKQRFTDKEFKERFSERMREIEHDEIWNKHVSDSLKGRHISNEHKVNVSLGLKEFHRNNPEFKSNGNKDMHWYNDGNHNICAKECPKGYYEGKIFAKVSVRSVFGRIFEEYYGIHRSDNEKLYMREYTYYIRHGKLKGK